MRNGCHRYLWREVKNSPLLFFRPSNPGLFFSLCCLCWCCLCEAFLSCKGEAMGFLMGCLWCVEEEDEAAAPWVLEEEEAAAAAADKGLCGPWRPGLRPSSLSVAADGAAGSTPPVLRCLMLCSRLSSRAVLASSTASRRSYHTHICIYS